MTLPDDIPVAATDALAAVLLTRKLPADAFARLLAYLECCGAYELAVVLRGGCEDAERLPFELDREGLMQ